MADPLFVTIPEAVQMLGLQRKRADRWLIRTLRARERTLGLRCLISDIKGKGARYRVNVETVRMLMPEMRGPSDYMADRLRREVAAVASQIRTLDNRLDSIESSLGALADAERRRARGIR